MEMIQNEHQQRAHRVHQVALELYRQNPDWVTFFREVLGVSGIVRKEFPEAAELAWFEQTGEYAEIQQMLTKLREQTGEPTDHREPTKVITVRLPSSLHEQLRDEAHQRRTSMNKLCISKLLQIVDEDLVPNDQ